MEFHPIDGLTAFLFVITFLLTDNRYVIIIVFTILVLIYDVRGGETPITTLPKLLLGRHSLAKGLDIIVTQIIGMLSAFIVYKFLVKYGIVMKHKLE